MTRPGLRASYAALSCLLFAMRAVAQTAPPAAAPPAEPPAVTPSEPQHEEDKKKKEGGEGGEEEGMDEISEADIEAELKAQEAEIKKAPVKGKGAITGVVTDVEHETLPEAQVSVVGNEKYNTVTDLEGRFRLDLPPGTYTIRIYFELHRPTVIKDIAVADGQVEPLDVVLVPDESSVNDVVIVDTLDRSTIEGQLVDRQRNAAVGDGVGRREISRTPAGNAAEASKRVVGATIVGNRFVYVRGLGERYTNALLNGAPLPSPEPDRAAIPLDLFPTLIIESVNIVKTFTPDVPGDFAGGSVRINTRELPSKPLFQVSLGLGYDTSSTFKDRLTHKGSGTDWLGFDHSVRALPDGFPSFVLLPGDPRPGGGTIDDTDLNAAGQSMMSSMSPKESFTPPNYSLSTVAGRSWQISGEQRFGALASLNYSRSFTRKEDVTLRSYLPDFMTDANGNRQEVLKLDRDFKADIGTDKVSWGALGSVSYWINQYHRFTLLGLHTQLADMSSQVSQGLLSDTGGGDIATARLRFVSRALNFLQLRGDHTFVSANHAELNWNASYAVAALDEPDTRNTVYQFNPDQQTWNFVNIPESGSHLFATQGEKSYGAGLDWTQPLLKDREQLKTKIGGLVSVKDRNFEARRFTYARVPRTPPDLFTCAGTKYPLDCPDKLFVVGSVGPTLSFSEDTFPSDSYDARLDIYAGYGMFDANIDAVRLVAGARVEHTDQTIEPYSQYASGGAPPGASVNSTDVLPALSATYSVTKKTKLRAAFSQTLARPQIRELSPFVYTDYFGARPVSGNPELKLTYINNYDLRFEAFPTGSEVLAFSFFYKTFKDPIEPVVTSNFNLSYQNSKGATLEGIELEARKGLGFLNDHLRDFSLIGNLTLANSQIELNRQISPNLGAVNLTNLDRPMVNQAPYVVNVALDYDSEASGIGVRVLYNIIGRRIVEVGTQTLDDSYEQPRHSLDVTASKNLGKHFQVKLNATNLIATPVRITLGKENEDDRVLVEYDEGRIFTLSGSYTY